MLRIAALNEDLSDDSSATDEITPPTKEAEESDCVRLYNEALQLRQKKDFESALYIFQQILSLPTVEKTVKEIHNLKDETPMSSILQIKYACLKNIGALCNQKKDWENALDAYLEALEVENNDVTVWFTVGTIAMQLNNYQLARHAFEQGMLCSPNHWPCLDGIIKVLFAVGDIVSCLFHINNALNKDPGYLMGHVTRDLIFRDMPSLRNDLKCLGPERSSSDLGVRSDFSEEEWKAASEAALSLRFSSMAAPITDLLPIKEPVNLAEISSWSDLGRILLKVHTQLTEENNTMMLSRALGLDLEKPAAEEPIFPDENFEKNRPQDDVDMSELDEKFDNQPEKNEADHNVELNLVESVETLKNQEIPDGQVSELPTEPEVPEKQENRKRKRSLEQCQLAPSNETQRRSTRSRAYAQQAEEEIYSLRAELRSYLPTALLFNDETDNVTKPEHDLPYQVPARPTIEPEEEQSGTLEFLESLKIAQSTIIETLTRFCSTLTPFESFTWPKELNDVYREAYLLARSHSCGPEVFTANSTVDGIQALIFCEIFLSHQRTRDSSAEIPTWFNEDLAYLFQLADPLTTFPSKERLAFQARVCWVHFCRYYQNGQLDEARHYLTMVYNCLHENENEDETVIHTHADDAYSTFSISRVQQLMQVLMRTLQLADVAKLHQDKDHKQVAEILKAALNDSKQGKQEHAPISRPSQWLMLLESLSSLDDYDQFIIWSERCLNESISEYLSCFAKKSSEAEPQELAIEKQRLIDWAEVIEKASTDLEEVIRTKRSSLNLLNHNAQVRLAENLVLICSHQLESDSSTKLPLNSTIYWVILHRMIEREELRLNALKGGKDDEKDGAHKLDENSEDGTDGGLACSTLFLISAHDLLGKRSWCMNNNGIFVLYLLEVLVRRRRTACELEDREELGRAIEQATFCALGYPTTKKMKSKTFCDHGGATVELTWNVALLVAEHYLPGRQELPEFDTMKPYSNVEQELFYKRIADLIPPELDPRNRVEDMEDFIQGRRPKIPKYLEHSGMPRQMENLFYLLADFYFKNKEWAKAIENYTLDLVLVPDRFDSWAALALATGSRLETKVNSCERMKNLKAFLDRAETALRCFRRALYLRPSHTTLWIEQGSTAYMLHSFCSQLLRNETDSFNIQMFERLEKEKERMLDIANDCFLAADKSWLAGLEKDGSAEQDERWLHHYMLGKVAEKRAKSFSEYIGYYQKAAQLLEESSAAYPKRISYNTPGHLSVEALEIYYRIHSNCLKVLMSQEGKQPDVELCRMVGKQLDIAAKSAFVSFGKKPDKSDSSEKETSKRKAAKHDEERPAKKSALERRQAGQLGGRGATIQEVNVILNEILEKVVSSSKLSCFENSATTMIAEVATAPLENVAPENVLAVPASAESQQKNATVTSCSSGSTSSSDSDDESGSSASNVKNAETTAALQVPPPAEPTIEPVPDLQSMIDSCLTAIKECVSRFPHFYKGTYRLAHYYYYSKAKRNLEACRELLFGRALSPSLAQLQQQQGTMQPRFLPVGIAGLFTEWRSNNFFHGIWRIPINEIDRPGCFAFHMGRSITLLIEVLKETKDHRLLMELALALQPEPEPDKKYLYDSEREQQASLATSLVVQVLRSRLQELKGNNTDASYDSRLSSPQQGSPSSSKKLSLLMDIYRTYDRIERNLPGQGAVFTSLLVETYKQYGNLKEIGESEESLAAQALEFCRNKQAQSKARITGTRSGPSSGSTVPVRGKRVATANRRSRLPAPTQPSLVRESNVPLPTSALSAPPAAPVPSHSSVMQEAMKLLQSAGGSADNLPQHLKNIPGISNLLALFSSPTRESSAPPKAAKPDTHTEKVEQKKELPAQKSSTSTRPSSSATTPVSSTSSISAVAASPALPTSSSSAASSLLSSFQNASIPNLGFLDPNMLALLANPYVNPLNMFAGPLLGSDPSALSKLHQEYQQQLMNSMQNAIAQSYVMSSLANPFAPPSRSRGRGGRKSSSRVSDVPKASQVVDMSTQKTAPVPVEQSVAGTSASAGTSAMDLSSYSAKPPKPVSKRPSEASHVSPKPAASRSDSRTSSSLPLDLKLPPPHFEDALKGVKPHSSNDYKKSVGPQTDLAKGKSISPSQNTSPSHGPKLPVPSSIDVAKFLADLPPSLDLKRLPKTDKRQSLPSSMRPKAEDQKPPSVASTGKAPASSKHSKTPTISFPINLGKEITLTATSSSKSAFPMPTKPTPKSSSRALPNVPHSLSSASSSVPIQGFPHIGGGKRELDPLGLVGFSLLQNLPSSMSLLVNTSPQAQAKADALQREIGVDKKGRATEQPMPKLTPAPSHVGSKKGKSIPAARPPSLQPNSSIPPSFAQSGNPLLPRASTSQKGYPTQHAQPSDKSQKKDSSSGLPDIVTLD